MDTKQLITKTLSEITHASKTNTPLGNYSNDEKTAINYLFGRLKAIYGRQKWGHAFPKDENNTNAAEKLAKREWGSHIRSIDYDVMDYGLGKLKQAKIDGVRDAQWINLGYIIGLLKLDPADILGMPESDLRMHYDKWSDCNGSLLSLYNISPCLVHLAKSIDYFSYKQSANDKRNDIWLSAFRETLKFIKSGGVIEKPFIQVEAKTTVTEIMQNECKDAISKLKEMLR